MPATSKGLISHAVNPGLFFSKVEEFHCMSLLGSISKKVINPKKWKLFFVIYCQWQKPGVEPDFEGMET